MLHPQCSKKCYLAVLHHTTPNLLSNFKCIIHFSKEIPWQCPPTISAIFKYNESFLNNFTSQCPSPPFPPSLCSTFLFNAMNMLPYQFHITNNQSNKNITPAILQYNVPPSSILFNAMNTILPQKFNTKLSVCYQECAMLAPTELILCHSSSY